MAYNFQTRRTSLQLGIPQMTVSRVLHLHAYQTQLFVITVAPQNDIEHPNTKLNEQKIPMKEVEVRILCTL
jgi:hypothetical protein